MLTGADDYPVHQTCEPIATLATTDRNFYDRYFFNGYSRDGGVFFAAALGQYPNRRVMDAAFNVVHRGRQYVVRASCRAGADRLHTSSTCARYSVSQSPSSGCSTLRESTRNVNRSRSSWTVGSGSKSPRLVHVMAVAWCSGIAMGEAGTQTRVAASKWASTRCMAGSPARSAP